MLRYSWACLLVVLVLTTNVRADILIDGFNDSQIAASTDDGALEFSTDDQIRVQENVQDSGYRLSNEAGRVGGVTTDFHRDIFLEYFAGPSAGSGSGLLVQAATTSSKLNLDSEDSDVRGNIAVVWDGADGFASGVVEGRSGDHGTVYARPASWPGTDPTWANAIQPDYGSISDNDTNFSTYASALDIDNGFLVDISGENALELDILSFSGASFLRIGLHDVDGTARLYEFAAGNVLGDPDLLQFSIADGEILQGNSFVGLNIGDNVTVINANAGATAGLDLANIGAITLERFSRGASDIEISSFSAVPEPSTYAMLCLAGLAGLAYRRRQKKTAA